MKTKTLQVGIDGWNLERGNVFRVLLLLPSKTSSWIVVTLKS